jgi:hypothetical protein
MKIIMVQYKSQFFFTSGIKCKDVLDDYFEPFENLQHDPDDVT